MKKTALTTVTIMAVVIVALGIIRLLNISYPVFITTTAKSSELAVVGEGKVDVVPDVAYVDAGVAVNNAKTVNEAQATINKVNNDIVAALAKLNVAKGDIKTSNYSIYPNYSYQDNISRIDGYNGNATITVKVRNTGLVAKVIEEATKVGANQVSGVRFTVEKPEIYRAAARAKAIENARQQAEKIAKSLGIKLGKVVNVVETTPGSYAPTAMRDMALGGAGGGGSPDLEAGSQTITSVVTLYFEKR